MHNSSVSSTAGPLGRLGGGGGSNGGGSSKFGHFRPDLSSFVCFGISLIGGP